MPTIQFTPPPPPPAPVAEAPAVPAPPVEVPAAAPAPVAPEPVAAEPEPVAEVPAADGDAPKTPFWKKELSFARKKEPKAPKQPKAEKPAKEQGDKTPFWKKEIGGKKKEPKAAKEPKAEKPPKEKGEKTPFWKMEIGGKKKTDADFDTPKAKKPKKIKAEKTPRQSSKSAKQTVVGLKIGASQIAAARVQNGPTPQLLQLAREPLDEGVVVGGELRDFETLAEALKEFFSTHKLPKRGVRLGIANNRIGVRTFDIAGIDDSKQLANAIRFRAQETLPIPLEEAVLDWRVLSETTDPETGSVTRRVLLVVAYRELVDRYVAACTKAGIRLAGIDLEAFAMLRALEAPTAEDAPPVAAARVVVNVGHDRSTLAVSDGRVCEFTRVLGWGGSALSVAIARALDLTPSEVEPIKHTVSLLDGAVAPEGVAPETFATATEAVRRELQAFARELVSSLRFYQNQPGSLGIGELVLTGGAAHLSGFSTELERLIGVPVTVGDPLNRLTIPKKVKAPEQLGSLAVAIGLGIDD